MIRADVVVVFFRIKLVLRVRGREIHEHNVISVNIVLVCTLLPLHTKGQLHPQTTVDGCVLQVGGQIVYGYEGQQVGLRFECRGESFMAKAPYLTGGILNHGHQ